MGKKLIIAEKPSVAQDIARALGGFQLVMLGQQNHQTQPLLIGQIPPQDVHKNFGHAEWVGFLLR